MKNILLLVHDDAGQESRFQAALDLTRSLNGHLTCLDVAAKPMLIGYFQTVAVQNILLAEERSREAVNRKRLEARLAHEGVSWTWLDVTDEPAAALEKHAGLADVIVVSRRLENDPLPDTLGIASEIVIDSGKTVVAVPELASGFEAGGEAMVAWNGSDEAVKALQAAVPLLELARTVTIVEVADAAAERPVEEAAAYLSRHGIRPAVIRRRGKIVPTADILLAEAKAEGADYIVMGAFSRSRLVEAILGGVSRTMLSESPIPVVMAH